MPTKGISNEEIKAAQELKDSRDFVYNTNQSLQTLSQGIISLSIQNEKVIAKSQSDHKALLIEFENLKENIVKSIKEMQQRIGDVESKLYEFSHSLKNLREEIVVKYLPKKEFYDCYVSETKSRDDFQTKMGEKNYYFNLALSTLKSQFNQDLEGVKKDLSPKVPEVDPIKKQLDERFSILKVDFDGLIREIAFLKKAVAYDQKKFENVYTLIERLKEGKQ